MKKIVCSQALASSPLGAMRLAATSQGLCGIWFEGQRHFPDTTLWAVATDNALLNEAAKQLQAYFSNKLTEFHLPLDLCLGTPFQQTVWQALLSLVSGQTCSYGELSQRLGKPTAVRAVASAIGRNPLSIVVPCHRVLGSTGALTGYAGGLERKAALLTLEKRL
jgi:methylated-DNA-[protein]-cysteine S-methyltransferase